MKRWITFLFLVSLTACGAAASLRTQVAATTAAAASGAVAEVTSPATQASLQKTVAAAVAPVQPAVEKVVVTVHDGAVQTATDARTAILDPDALDAARERLLGAPLRADVDQLIDAATPKLETAVAKILAPIQADAAVTAQRFKEIAIGLAVGVGVMVVALGVALWEIYRHRRYLAELTASIAARHAAGGPRG